MHSKAAPIDRNNLLGAFEVFLDPVVLTLSLWLLTLHFEGEFPPPYLLLSVLLFALTFPGTSQLQTTVWNLMLNITINWLWVAGLLLFLGFASRYLKVFSSELLITWLWVAPLSQFGAHLALRVLAPIFISMQGPPLRAIIVGMNEQGMALANRIKENPYLLVDLCGFFDDRRTARLNDPGNFKILGKLEDLPGYVKQNYIQRIYISLPMASQPRILQVLDELMDTTASIYFVPDMFITDLIQGRTGSVCGMPVISVCESPFAGSSGLVKRSSDIVLSLLILALISPLLLCIAIAVKLTSPGPVIFKQRRYGLDGKEILVYKFRTMTVCEDGGSIRQAQKNDSRFTPLGRFLRKSSMDELPQFVNVLQGRMSIVGPRPHAIAHNELYRKLIKGYMIRHKVKPGITGWAQVNGFRGETETLDKMQGRIDYDLDYLRNWSLSLDLQIILKTILVVFKDQSAY
ncbi:MAG: undecaprenyl-phosphate glucose phosphotransferase [Propionivibrio sp.]|nr:undecaprenyl-phosphate glucose phosphotransferase [Propionivibrio sp.]